MEMGVVCPSGKLLLLAYIQHYHTRNYFQGVLRDLPIFRTDLQIRTTFGLGWVGGFIEMGCSDFKGNQKSVHPEIPYCLSISSHCSFILSFCEIFSLPLVNFLLGING